MILQDQRTEVRNKLSILCSKSIIEIIRSNILDESQIDELDDSYRIATKIALFFSVESITKIEIDKSLINTNSSLSTFKEITTNIDKIRYNMSNFSSISKLQSFIKTNSRLITEEDLGGISEFFSGHKAILEDGNIILVHNPDRRNFGKFYTPYDVTKHMCKDISQKMVSSSESLEDLFAKKVLDPAVGSGAFVSQLVRCLWKSSSRKWELDDEFSFRRKVCETIIHACDIDKQALELYKIIIWISAGSPQFNLDLNLSLCDSLSKGPCLNKDKWTELTNFDIGEGYFCVIGNPPYVRVPKNNLLSFETNDCNNLYSAFVELSLNLLHPSGHMSLIVPQSLMASKKFQTLRDLLLSQPGSKKFQVFDSVPGFLFNQGKIDSNSNKSINQRTVIVTISKNKSKKSISVSHLLRWRSSERNLLFTNLKTIKIRKKDTIYGKIPMIYNREDKILIRKLRSYNKTIGDVIDKENGDVIFVGKAVRYFITGLQNDNLGRDNMIELRIEQKYFNLIHVIINSNLFYWWWRINGNGFQVELDDILTFPLIEIEETISEKKSHELIDCIEECRGFKNNAGKKIPYVNYNIRQDLLQEIDRELFSKIGLEMHERIFTCKSNSIFSDMSRLVGYEQE